MRTITDEPTVSTVAETMDGQAATTERVGQLEMKVTVAKPSVEAEQRWEQRVDALATWLFAEWQREQKKAA